MEHQSDESSDPDTPEAFKAVPKGMDGLRAVDVMPVLHERVAYLSGGRDLRGGAIIIFPASAKREKLKHEDYKPLLQYLTSIPNNEIREMKFTVIVDMRGSTWSTVKPILKELHESFASHIYVVHIVKPDNFWQKQRTSIGSHKYKFETNIVSLENLAKHIDTTQLPKDFDGTLPYDHNTWIELRLAIEEFMWHANEILDQLEDVRDELSLSDFAEDVNGAKRAIEKHNDMYEKVSGAQINEVDLMGQRLLQRLNCDEGSGYDSGYSGRDSAASLILNNPDFQNSIPQILKHVDSVHEVQQHLKQLWQHKKVRLDQCLDLRIFELDAEKMFDWLYHNREEFLMSYVEIGHSYRVSKDLQNSHNQFTSACRKVYSSINKIMNLANLHVENGHYAAQHINNVASRLDQVWKEFASGLEGRSSVLSLSVLFHQQAEQYIENVPAWVEACKLGSLPSDILNLEASIHSHMTFYENMCQKYTEVHSTSKKLLYEFDNLVQICSLLRKDAPVRGKHKKPRGKPSAYSVTPDGKVVYKGNPAQQPGPQGQQGKNSQPQVKNNPAADYSEGASHVLAVIHEILGHHRAVEQRWSAKKLKLHQRLALRLFQEDVKQVLDWLRTHGEVFMNKNLGIGRNLQRTRLYQKSHEHFETVAQNTYTNAEKLLQAAEELAHTGECHPEDIYNVAKQLDSHIASFAARVQQRRRLLEMAIRFYTHEQELLAWLQELVLDLQNNDHILEMPDNIQHAERLLNQLTTQRDSTLEASISTVHEGEALLEELRALGIVRESNCGSMEGLEESLNRLNKKREELETLWAGRKIRLDLLLQLRLFHRDSVQLLDQLDAWCEKLQKFEFGRSISEAEHLLNLHNDSSTHMQNALLNLIQHGKDLLQLLNTSRINLQGGNAEEEMSKINMVLDCLVERQTLTCQLAEVKRVKLEQRLQLLEFEKEANQVINWIRNGESMLTACFTIPSSLPEANALSRDNQKVQVAIEKTHSAVVQIRQKSSQLFIADHYSPEDVIEIESKVTKRWEKLVTCVEDRYKLIQASISFYKTAEQVCSVLESLNRDYQREEDWCQKDNIAALSSSCENQLQIQQSDYHENSKNTAINFAINKHQDQKESFLKACTLARRTAETFLKYTNRTQSTYNVNTARSMRGPELKVRGILENLMIQENAVLDNWTQKKKRLEQCQQFILFEDSAKQALEWILETGEKYLQNHSSLGSVREETERYLREHEDFKTTARDTREKVKLLMLLAENLVEKGHAHASAIKEWVSRVDEAYKKFSGRMDQYRRDLESRLGISSEDGKGSLSLDRISDPSLDQKLQGNREQNEAKRRSARKKELIMRELLSTEKAYVTDLEICVKTFLYQVKQPTAPAPLQGKDSIIFCNIEEILNFHKQTFLEELKKYESMPEDVGHCFVTWAPEFDIYVKYCKAQPESNRFLVSQAGTFFEEVQRTFKVEHPIPAYLIKPVQRITKYQLLLRELLSCCEHEYQGEIKEGLEVMQNVPKKANDALHLSMLEGCDVPLDSLGEVVLQDQFQVWDPRQIIRKGRDRHVFLFDLYLLFSKESKDPSGKTKYQYKTRLVTSELLITEFVDGDECKFAVSNNRSGLNDGKTMLKASTLETKQTWVRKLRQIIQETYLSSALPMSLVKSPVKIHSSINKMHRTSRNLDDDDTNNLIDNDMVSLASYSSSNTDNSERGLPDTAWVIEDYESTTTGDLTVTRGQQVDLVSDPTSAPASRDSSDWVMVRVAPDKEGYVPSSVLRIIAKAGSKNELEVPSESGSTSGTSDTHIQSSNQSGATSPVLKKKGFSSRKWFPQPLRKLSQPKVDSKLPSPSGLNSAPLPQDSKPRLSHVDEIPGAVPLKLPAQFTYSLDENVSKLKLNAPTLSAGLSGNIPQFKYKLNDEMGNKLSSEADENESRITLPKHHGSLENGDCVGELEDLEIPSIPKMQIFSHPLTAAGSGSQNGGGSTESDQLYLQQVSPGGRKNAFESDRTGTLASELENIVKKKIEEHESGEWDLREIPTLGLFDPRSPTSPPLASSPGHRYSDSYLRPTDSAGGVVEIASPCSDPNETKEEREIRRRKYVIRELIETERLYVSDLQSVVEGFLSELRDPTAEIPDEIREGRDKIVFGNIEAIYEWHRDHFSKNVEAFLEHPERIGPVFERSENKFQMYVKYCQNKPKSEYIVSEHFDFFEELRLKLGQKLQLPDLLIKPVQRLMKYQLMLRDILKHTERAGLTKEAELIRRALHIMTVVPKSADDMMNVGRLQGFKGKIMAQGKLLLFGPLLCFEKDSVASFRAREMVVFLFEQSVIFSEPENSTRKKAFSNQEYTFKAYFLMNTLHLDSQIDPSDPLKFQLKSVDPTGQKPTVGYICQATDRKQRDEWVCVISQLLEAQNDFLNAIQSPIAYQKEQTKYGPSWTMRIGPDYMGLYNQPEAVQHQSSLPEVAAAVRLPAIPRRQSDPTTDQKITHSDSPHPSLTKPSILSRNKSVYSNIYERPPNLSEQDSESFKKFGHIITNKPENSSPTKSGNCSPKSGFLSPSKSSRKHFFRLPLISRSYKPDRRSTMDPDLHDRHDFPDRQNRYDNRLLYHDRNSLTPPVSPSTPTSVGNRLSIEVGMNLKILSDFNAVREDEISVYAGETVQVLSCNKMRGFLVHRPANPHSPAAEGWIPAYVIVPDTQNIYENFDGLNREGQIYENLTPLNREAQIYENLAGVNRKSQSDRISDQNSEPPVAAWSSEGNKRELDDQIALESRAGLISPDLRPGSRSGLYLSLSPFNPDFSQCNSQEGSLVTSPQAREALSTRHQTRAVALINPYNPDLCQKSPHMYSNPGNFGIDSPDAPIKFLAPLNNVTARPGEPVNMACQVSGYGVLAETLNVRWIGPHGELLDPRFELEQRRDGSFKLFFATAKKEDSGEYTCIISTGSFSVSCSAILRVISQN